MSWRDISTAPKDAIAQTIQTAPGILAQFAKMYPYFHTLFLNCAVALNCAVPLREKKNGAVTPVFFLSPTLNCAGAVWRSWRSLSNLPYKYVGSSCIRETCSTESNIPEIRRDYEECSLFSKLRQTAP